MIVKYKKDENERVIRENILSYFKETNRKKSGVNPLLDGITPDERREQKEDFKGIYERMKQDKGISCFTVTFKQVLRDEQTEEENRRYLMYVIRTLCFNSDIPIEVILIPDVDEAGNYHYHGLIKMPLKYRPRFKRLMTKYIGYIKYSYLRDIEGWTKYCFKEDIYEEEDIRKLFIYMKL